MKKTRNTIQRMKILQHLKSVKDHPTAQKVYEAVVKELPSITLATVYRNLNLLAEKGEIVRFELNNEYRYDAEKGNHQHGVCRKCRGIFNFYQNGISDYAMQKLNVSDFNASSVLIIYDGVCSRCSKK